MFWFLSEIALRRVFEDVNEGLGFVMYTTYAPVVATELRSQLEQWHHNLPAKIRFSHGTDPILNPQMAFLKAQYYSAVCIIDWPSIVRFLTSAPTDAEHEASLLNAAASFVTSAIDYIYAAESLLLERYVMLFAKQTGLYAIAMMLLCCYATPGLDSVQDLRMVPAVQKAHDLLSIWVAYPNVRANVLRIEHLMSSKGISPVLEHAVQAVAPL